MNFRIAHRVHPVHNEIIYVGRLCSYTTAEDAMQRLIVFENVLCARRTARPDVCVYICVSPPPQPSSLSAVVLGYDRFSIIGDSWSVLTPHPRPTREHTHLGYAPVGLSDGRVLVVLRVDGQVDGHGRPSPPFLGVRFEPARERQILRVRPRGQVRRSGGRRMFGRRWRRHRRRLVQGPLPRVRPDLQQVQQADHLVEFVLLQDQYNIAAGRCTIILWRGIFIVNRIVPDAINFEEGPIWYSICNNNYCGKQ